MRALAFTLLVLVVAAGAAAFGWTLAERAAADGSEREVVTAPDPVTLPAEMRRIETAVVEKGQIGFAQAFSMPLLHPRADRARLVTKGVLPGATTTQGASLVEIDGRPVVVYFGHQPAYRNIDALSRGQDVQQLQQALAEIGVYDGPADGVFGTASQEAVARLYAANGHSPITMRALTKDNALKVDRLISEIRAGVGDQMLPCLSSCAEGVTAAVDQVIAITTRRGIVVPLNETFFVPKLLRVGSPGIAVGQLADQLQIVLTDLSQEVIVTTDLETANLVHEGMDAELTTERGLLMMAQVVEVVDVPDASGNYVTRLELVEAVDSNEGVFVTVRIPVSATDGTVLSVPVSTLSQTADGRQRVQVVGNQNILTNVFVETGLVADGYAEIVNSDPALSEGALLLVGYR